MPDDFDDFFSTTSSESGFSNKSDAKDIKLDIDMDSGSSVDFDEDSFWNTESSNMDNEEDDSYLDDTDDLSGTASDDSMSTNGSQSNDERQRSLKKIAFFALGLAAVLIIIVCIIARIVSNSKAAESSANDRQDYTRQETVSNRENVNKNNTPVSNNTAVSNHNDWILIDASTFGTIDTNIESIFTVTDVRTYAKTLNNGEFQVRTEATGNIAGLTGTYVLDIPFNVTGVVELGQQLAIVYSIGEKGDSKIIGDIKLQ